MHAGRRRRAVELHGSVGQRDTLLHDGRPLVRRRREGAAAHGHQCNENFLHRNLGVLQADLLCSVGEHEAISTSFFFGCEGAVDVLLQFRTLFNRQKRLQEPSKIGVGFSQRKNQRWRLAFVDSAHLGACKTIASCRCFNRTAACHACAALVPRNHSYAESAACLNCRRCIDYGRSARIRHRRRRSGRRDRIHGTQGPDRPLRGARRR